MKKFLLSLIILFTTGINTTKANTPPQDSLRLAELDHFWTELSRTVKEGDFEGYKAAYHEDAVVVFATGEKKTSVPIAKALANWKKGFVDTKNGKRQDKVEFRFSQRIGDKTTAHETGIFVFTSADNQGNVTATYIINFEMLLIKRDNTWYAIMEHQKSATTQKEWEALK